MNQLRIVIPTKNEENYLPSLLQSIRKQTFTDLEVIVADANSKDKTESIARSFNCGVIQGGYPDVGRNNGAVGCTSPLICFMDSDTVLPNPYFIERSLDELSRRNLDIAGTIQKPILTGNLTRDLFYKGLYGTVNLSMSLLQNTNRPFMQNVMFMRTCVHRDLYGFPPYEFGEDSAFAQEAVLKGYKFGILKKPGRIWISPRRFEKDGILHMMKKYIYFNGLVAVGHKFYRGKSRIHYWADSNGKKP